MLLSEADDDLANASMLDSNEASWTDLGREMEVVLYGAGRYHGKRNDVARRTNAAIMLQCMNNARVLRMRVRQRELERQVWSADSSCRIRLGRERDTRAAAQRGNVSHASAATVLHAASDDSLQSERGTLSRATDPSAPAPKFGSSSVCC